MRRQSYFTATSITRPFAETIVLASTDIGGVILMISALLLRISVQTTHARMGKYAHEAKNVMVLHPEQMLPAGIAITLAVTAFNLG